MRNKFTELIEQGVASFEYTPIAPEIPEQDFVCRMYNNIFSIPSDTHMACIKCEETGEDVRVITGHMIANTEKWREFGYSSNWGAVTFRPSGYWCLDDFLYKCSLECNIGTLNGDIVAFVTPRKKIEDTTMMPQVSTNESKVPMPVTVITTSGNVGHVAECFGGDMDETIKKLNESAWIKGTNWVPTSNGIVGLVGDKVYIMGDINEAREYHRYSMQIDPFKDNHTDGIKLTVWDCMWDSHWYATIDGSGKVTYCSKQIPGRDKTFVADNFLAQLEDNDFDWTEEFPKDLSLNMAYMVTMKGPWEKSGWKIKKCPGYEIFFGVTSIGQLKKRTR